MSDIETDHEREFLKTGAETYLDADDAMAAFRHKVQDEIAKVLSMRLDEINQACNMNWTRNDLKDYEGREKDRFYVGKQVVIKNFGVLYFYLRIYRENGFLRYAAVADLYRQRRSLAADLWSEGNDLLFERQLAQKESVPDFPEHLNNALDDFITFFRGRGGLQKYLPSTQTSA